MILEDALRALLRFCCASPVLTAAELEAATVAPNDDDEWDLDLLD